MSSLPSKEDLLRYVRENPRHASKRDISRHFGIKGAARMELKAMLRELQASGEIEKRSGRRFVGAGEVPPVAVMRVGDPDADGDVFLTPMSWEGDDAPPRVIFVARKSSPAVGRGDRVLVRLEKVATDGIAYEARLIRRIGAGADKVVGIFRTDSGGGGGRIASVDKGSDREWLVPQGETGGAKDGELVEAERLDGRKVMGLPKARVVEVLGDPMAPKSISLIAIHEHQIRDVFPPEVLKDAAGAKPVTLGSREDLRHVPLVTIDPSDARDHDDAIAALPDPDPANADGWVLWVAIADVAHYVRPGSDLDREARKRGNSTYFPDRVVPMLPEELSGDLCSLHEGVDRPCMALEIRIDAHGKKLSHRFTRGLMRSPASLSYEQAQAGAEGNPDAATGPLVESVIRPLWSAWAAVHEERGRRRPLDLDLPERRIVLSEAGEVTSVAFRDRFDAHRVVEDFMILANVCAAETLEAKQRRFLYRVHEEPSEDKIKSLRDMAGSMGLSLAKGQVLKTWHLNKLLNEASGSDHAEAVNISVLRSMPQAYYSPDNLGHFGLALQRYAHFTSPIRRYSDLIVHRALIAAHGWGDDGMTPQDEAQLGETAEHISQAERRSMMAERDTTDRYLSAYLKDRIGNEFEGRISGIARFGMFVKLAETGADGLVPISSLGREYFRYDDKAGTLTGEDTGRTFAIGQRVEVKLLDAVPITGGLLLELIAAEGVKVTPGPRRGGSKSIKRKGKGKGRPKRAKKR